MPAEMVIQEWVGNLTSDQTAVQQALSDLQNFMQKNPSDPDVPFHIAKANLFQAQELTRLSPLKRQPPEATALYVQTVDMFDKLMKGDGLPSQDNNAAMHHRFAMILELLSTFDQSAVIPTDDPITQGKKAARPCATNIGPWQNKKSNAPPPWFAPRIPITCSILNTAIDVADEQGDYDGAVKICRSLPPYASSQLRLSQLLARKDSTRPEAEQILNSMLFQLHDDPNHIVGFAPPIMTEPGRFRDRRLRPRSFGRSTQGETDGQDADRTVRPAQRAAPAEIQVATGTYRSGIGIDLRREQARLLLLQGQTLQLMQISSPSLPTTNRSPTTPSCLTCVADAYANLNQIGRAISVVRIIVSHNPTDLEAQKFLVKLLVHDAPEKAAAPLTRPHGHATPTIPNSSSCGFSI